ncbi:MAG: hypothetical protein CVT88_03545 [Candidatus Altiarchaeales archaeon HGW-Altiarchaeales-1]|nr:MAG: hypothetical protein CVT89_06060 [Candidatus Altiarchaeales archaeon HGW-Altiarchaeales-2]PKP60190.1 MAG: hypothetical protein CVT88_03545 [Candidatus Altiarchaeales archaeon HGW-Altiarchaeales-1]
MIREARHDDLKTIVEIYNSYLQNFEFPIDELFLLYSLEDKNFKIFVWDDKIIKGFCGIYFYPDASTEIGPIAVDRKFLNRHIGTALLQYLLNFAEENNVRTCTARVSDKNLNAIKFFTDNGFIPETTANSIVYFVKYIINP